MPRSCCVPGCKSNYDRCYATTSFTFPKDPARREQWLKAINRKGFTPTAHSAVCIKHFVKEFVILEDSMVRPDGTIITAPRGRPGLRKCAYPSIFPGVPEGRSYKRRKVHNTPLEGEKRYIVQNDYTDDRDYKCERCNSRFFSSLNFKLHMSSHTNNEAVNVENPEFIIPDKELRNEFNSWTSLNQSDGTGPQIKTECVKREEENVDDRRDQLNVIYIKEETASIDETGPQIKTECVKREEENSDDRRDQLNVVYIKEETKSIDESGESITESYVENEDKEIATDTGEHAEVSFDDGECPEAPGVKFYKCELCNREFKYRRGLYRHRKLHTEEKRHECSMCGLCCLNSWKLETHMRLHSQDNPMICAVCNKKFTDKSNLQTHLVSHVEKKSYSCSLCAKVFTNKSDFRRHMNQVHAQNQNYDCVVCGQVFLRLSCVKRHMSVHSGDSDRLSRCRYCKKIFKGERALSSHLKAAHNDSRYFNWLQSNTTGNLSSDLHLQQHNMVTHEKEPPAADDFSPTRFKTEETGDTDEQSVLIKDEPVEYDDSESSNEYGSVSFQNTQKNENFLNPVFIKCEIMETADAAAQ